MQDVLLDEGPPETRSPRFTGWDLCATGLLAATVGLHVVAMFPAYFGGTGSQGSLAGQPDQAALYAILAASWAFALGLFVSGRSRRWVGAGLAVGIAATELGFRLTDLGEVFRYGSSEAGAGLWLMTAAWIVGAAGAVIALIAARAGDAAPAPFDSVTDQAEPDVPFPLVAGPVPPPPPGAPDPAVEDTAPATRYPTAALVICAVLAVATAGAYLPAWDHYLTVSSATGGSISFNLGDAWNDAWQIVIGSFVVAGVLLILPVVALTLRRKDLGVAMVIGALLVMAGQFTSAVVQVNEAVPASILGLTPSRASQLGLSTTVRLTGWFTLDVLAAFGLFALAVVLFTIRPAYEGPAYRNSPGTFPSAPAAPSEATFSSP